MIGAGRAPCAQKIFSPFGDEDRNEISRYLPLAFLAPDIVEKILKGLQPVDLTAEKLRRLGSLPYQWDEQRAVLGFTV